MSCPNCSENPYRDGDVDTKTSPRKTFKDRVIPIKYFIKNYKNIFGYLFGSLIIAVGACALILLPHYVGAMVNKFLPVWHPDSVTLWMVGVATLLISVPICLVFAGFHKLARAIGKKILK